MHRSLLIVVIAALVLVGSAPGVVFGSAFTQTNLVTSTSDPDLINPWGIAFSPMSPF